MARSMVLPWAAMACAMTCRGAAFMAYRAGFHGTCHGNAMGTTVAGAVTARLPIATRGACRGLPRLAAASPTACH